MLMPSMIFSPFLKCPFRKRSENCSTPPTTPLDELALKRHRCFNDLIDAAQAAIDQRERFDSLDSILSELPKSKAADECEPPTNSNLNVLICMHVNS